MTVKEVVNAAAFSKLVIMTDNARGIFNGEYRQYRNCKREYRDTKRRVDGMEVINWSINCGDTLFLLVKEDENERNQDF